MKRIFVYTLCLFLVLFMTACGSKKKAKKIGLDIETYSPEEFKVETAYEGKYSWELEGNEITFYDSINIPKINIETEVTKDINDNIKSSFESRIDAIKDERPTGSKYGNAYTYDVTYSSETKDDIMYILIKISYTGYNEDTVNSDISYQEYIYDAKNDKKLSKKEICEKYEFDFSTYKEDHEIACEIMDALNYSIMPTSSGFDIYYNDEILEI